MAYFDGFLIPVPEANKERYLSEAQKFSKFLKDNGAIAVCETWGDDVPEGKVTSFPMAVKREEGENIVLSWVEWPDKETRMAAHEKMQNDPVMTEMDMPFDGMRMIFGGFEELFRA